MTEPTHIAMFFCSIGIFPIAGPTGKLFEALVGGLWKGRPRESRPVIVSVKLVRKGFEVETKQPLADDDRVAIERLCSEYDSEANPGPEQGYPVA